MRKFLDNKEGSVNPSVVTFTAELEDNNESLTFDFGIHQYKNQVYFGSFCANKASIEEDIKQLKVLEEGVHYAIRELMRLKNEIKEIPDETI